MKKILLLTITAAAFAFQGHAAVLGTETGASWTTGTWANGAVGSIGTWYLVTNGTGATIGSTEIGDSSTGGRTSIGSSAFNIIPGSYTNANQGYMNAYLLFSGGALSTGQTLSFDLNFLWNNGTKGFALQTAGGGTDIFGVQQNWGNPLYSIFSGATNSILANGYQQAITLQAAQQSGSILLTVLNNGTNIFSNNYTTTDTIGQIKFYAGNLDPAEEGNRANQSIYANNISVVPEPSTYALLALSAAGFAGYVARRRARK